MFFRLAIAALLPSLAAAGDPAWTTHGPDAGHVTAVSVDPANPAIVYAGTGTAGIFKTVDGGALWSSSNAGLPVGTIADVVVDPSRPATVYAISGGSLFRTTDAAAHWTELVLPAVPPGRVYVQSLAFDPQSPDTLLVAGCNDFFKSADGGNSWTENPITSAGGILCPTHLTVDRADSLRLYAATAEGLLRSADGGASWVLPLRAEMLIAAGALFQTCDAWGFYFAQATGTAAPKPEVLNACAGARDTPVHVEGYLNALRYYIALQPNPAMYGILAGPEAIALDPRASGTIYVSTYWGLFKSTDFGGSWMPSVSGLPKAGIIPGSLTIDSGATLYVSASSPAQRAVYRSIDGGASWTAVADFDVQPPTLLFADARNAGVVYGSNSLSLYRTTDRGVTWAPINRGISTSNVASVAVDPEDANRVFAVVFPPIPSGGAGLFESVDAGVTWTETTLPVDNASSVVTAPGGLVYAVACCVANGPGMQSGALLRSADRGATWVNPGAPPKDGVGRLIVDWQDPFTVYTQTRAGIASSTDGGVHWQERGGADLFKPGIAVLVADPAQRGALYASRYNSDAKDGGIYRSADRGATWEALNTGWPKDLYNVVALVVDPREPSTLYAIAQELDCEFYECPLDYFERLRGAPDRGLWKTTDSGRTWSKLPFPTQNPPYRLLGDPRDPSTLYAIAESPNRMFRSNDAGAMWTDISPGLLGTIISSLAVAGAGPNALYAGTYGAGVFELTVSGQ